MKKFGRYSRTGLAAVFVLSMVLASTPSVYAEDEVTIDLAGDMVPGGTVTATVMINDGSTFQSAAWTQTAGVEAALTGTDTQMLTAVLGNLATYKDTLFLHLTEPPITEDQLPPGVELPEGEFPGGLPARWGVVGVNPHAVEVTALVVFDVTVVTDSGIYEMEVDIHTAIPWKPAAGINNVATGLTVLINSATQTSYAWTLMSRPAESVAVLRDKTTAHPEFTPDVEGRYKLKVTDEATTETVIINVYAGTWKGIIIGKDGNDRPVVDSTCNICHEAIVADWAQTGHAEIFTNNVNTPAEDSHYGERCFSCHAVGYDPDVENGGFDNAADYQAFLDTFFPDGHPATTEDSWTDILADYPDVAKKANIQCENCHGPQETQAHTAGAPRQNLSSDICATCHGEPLRHARFQQWQLSGHANYELAIDEAGDLGDEESCARCHTANGFLAWEALDFDPDLDVLVTWTENDVHPQTCVTCHDPHNVGSTTGVGTDAPVRIEDDTPMLTAGFMATDVGRGAICMTCHNSRRGLRNSGNWDEVGALDPVRAPHGGTQTDVLMGQNAYFANIGDRSYHADVGASCATCHMEKTPPPDDLSYNYGGTNHTFFARNDICVECHGVVTAPDVQGPFMDTLHELEEVVETGWMDIITAQTAAGNTIAVGDATITDAAEVSDLTFTETRGRQALAVDFVDGTQVGAVRLTDIDVVPPTGDPIAIYEFAADELMQGGWNALLFHNDGSKGVHNPSWTQRTLAHTIVAIEEGGSGEPGDATGPGVSCTTDYTYWTEIAAHLEGQAGSIWRTDVAVRNPNDGTATIQFILHSDSGNHIADGAIPGRSQGVFEDVVGIIGEETKGALEICSDMPLELVARIFNESAEGTFGQYVDGLTNLGGMIEGQSARLLGLRQEWELFRTNISVTNTGMEDAEVEITLYSTDGTALTTYILTVQPGRVVQDLEPFNTRAGENNLGWGFAEVEVLSGSGVLCSASVLDYFTNDATTIPMKR